MIYNKEQISAINSATNFIKVGNPNEYYLIEGKAGTGKTTVIKEVLNNFKNRKIIVGALAHKAKNVIRESITNTNTNIQYSSIAGMLNLTLDLETGIFKSDYNNNSKKHISNYNIIVIDEASMVNEEMVELIFKEKNKNAKVLFLGDIGQLPPIRTKENPYFMDWTNNDLSKNSEIFNTNNKSVLLERVRQGEESPILPYADFYWENSQRNNPLKNPTNLNDRKTIINDKGALIFVNETKEIFKKTLELYRISIENNKPNIIKYVTYRNKTRKLINQYIHKYFYGNDCNTFQKGELIIFNDNFGDIENSSEFQIVERYPEFYDKIDNLKLYSIDIIFDSKLHQLVLLHPDSFNKHDLLIKEKFKIAFNIKKEINTLDNPKEKKELKERYFKLLKEAWDEKYRFPNIDYAYAVNTHKSQGSTYDTVVIHEQDISTVSLINDKNKSQSIYTALTRSKNISIVISSERIYDVIDIEKINLIEINNKINNGK